MKKKNLTVMFEKNNFESFRENCRRKKVSMSETARIAVSIHKLLEHKFDKGAPSVVIDREIWKTWHEK